MKKILLVIGVLVIAVIVYMKFSSNPSSGEVADVTKKSEPKTANYIKEKAGKYWDAVIYGDHHAKYDFMCNEVTDFVSVDQYVQKYKEDDTSITTDYALEDPVIDGDNVRIRTKLISLLYPEGSPGMTEMRYEDNGWCKVLSQDTVLWLKGEGE